MKFADPSLVGVSEVVEYGHEAKPSISGLQNIFLATRRDYDRDDYGARQEL